MSSEDIDQTVRISQAGGEQAVIDWFSRNASSISPNMALGIGDDCAVVSNAGSQLVTTDILIENTHFRTDINHYYDIGWKSVAVNLSDIAAMGGIPTYTFLSIGLPDMIIGDAYRLFEGIRDCAEAGGSIIAGGDTVFSSDGIVISVMQLGTVGSSGYVKRSSAGIGDAVVVTGTLGDSLAGLKLLLMDGLSAAESKYPYLVNRHIRPNARLKVSQALVKTGHINAMMDLSDGLCKDLRRLCEASGVGAEISSDMLPVSSELHKATRHLKTSAVDLAASGGEDYELLFTCPSDKLPEVMDSIDHAECKLTVIGIVTHSSGVDLVDKNNAKIPWPVPWEHF